MIRPKDIPLTWVIEVLFLGNTWRYAETGCLLWMGPIATTGYKVLSNEGNDYLAHRVAYCVHHGVTNTPEGLILDHLCCVRPCVEWSHLETVTQAINVARGKKAEQMREQALLLRKTHCSEGHPLEGDNLLLSKRERGWMRRRCRLCTYARNAVYRQQPCLGHKLGV
jgi:hypothetical protein